MEKNGYLGADCHSLIINAHKMNAIFWLCWLIDLFLLFLCLYETFWVSSNSSWALPAIILTALVIAALYFRADNPKIALGLAMLPTALLIAYFVVLIYSGSRSNWR